MDQPAVAVEAVSEPIPGAATPPSDRSCLLACVAGDPNAMDILVDRYQSDLLRTASALLGDRTAAQDAVQEAFLRLCRERERLSRDDRPLGGWLTTVVRNGCLDQLRSRRRPVPVVEAPAPQPDPQPDGDSLWTAVHALPALERAAVLLRYRDDLSYQEIAERLDKTVTHVGVLLHTALNRLRADARLREVTHV